MGEKTEIAWCDSTFNPWIGCQKVSAGCDNCYAETLMDKRYKRVEWGQRKMLGIDPSVGTRVRTSKSNWALPRRWERQHEAFQAEHGYRQRVFCSSLADVFDNQVPASWRDDLFVMIKETPHLDWLLLTKRPENISKMLRFNEDTPTNIWLGTTCENQEMFDKRWPILLETTPAVRFVSYEPAIGHLSISMPKYFEPDWVICGGESGPGYREMPEAWAASIKDECVRKDVPFFMKQMAGKKPIPGNLMLRQFPKVAA